MAPAAIFKKMKKIVIYLQRIKKFWRKLAWLFMVVAFLTCQSVYVWKFWTTQKDCTVFLRRAYLMCYFKIILAN